jgi:hypothetical protein
MVGGWLRAGAEHVTYIPDIASLNKFDFVKLINQHHVNAR